jgi:uncharacterized membrane protein
VKVEGSSSKGGDSSRIESFSDNVFGFALTLLVLTIKVPTIPPGDQPGYLLQQLGEQWPSYVTYVLSFVTVLLMWINHHVMFQRVQIADHALMFLNGMMLLPVTLVPFPTSLLAVFIRHPQARYAAALFAGSFVLMAGSYNLVWNHITRINQREGVEEDLVVLRHRTKKIRLVFWLYIAAFVIAFIEPRACIGFCFLLAIYLSLPELRNTAD